MNHNQTILLVDDSENDLILMRMAFKRAQFNYAIQELANGEAAVAYLKGDHPYCDRQKFPFPAAVLLDLNMPMKNGFEVLKWVRTQPGLKRLPLIILTASERTEDIEQAFELGANAYLVKPRTLEELVSLIRCLGDWLRYNHFPPRNSLVKKEV